MYIKINLLPPDLRPRKTYLHFDVKALAVLAAILAIIGLGGYYSWLRQQVNLQKVQLDQLRREQMSLQGMVDLQKEVESLRTQVVERVEIIRQLTADSDIRFDMLKHINGIIPENLWLLGINEMNQSGGVYFSIEGMSYTKRDISRFLEGLQRYRKFRSVALESITPSPTEARDAFQFIVKVEPEGLQAKEDSGKGKKTKPSQTASAQKK